MNRTAEPLDVALNNQTEFKLDHDQLSRLCQWFRKRESLELESLSVAVIRDEEMADLNRTYHSEEGTTDVLSFHYEDGSGEVLLNPYQHVRQCEEFDNDPSEEFTVNLIHALLHLSGYDHTEDDGEQLERQAELVEAWFGETDRDPILTGTP
jgi:probable rRNA maturation factor